MFIFVISQERDSSSTIAGGNPGCKFDLVSYIFGETSVLKTFLLLLILSLKNWSLKNLPIASVPKFDDFFAQC